MAAIRKPSPTVTQFQQAVNVKAELELADRPRIFISLADYRREFRPPVRKRTRWVDQKFFGFYEVTPGEAGSIRLSSDLDNTLCELADGVVADQRLWQIRVGSDERQDWALPYTAVTATVRLSPTLSLWSMDLSVDHRVPDQAWHDVGLSLLVPLQIDLSEATAAFETFLTAHHFGRLEAEETDAQPALREAYRELIAALRPRLEAAREDT